MSAAPADPSAPPVFDPSNPMRSSARSASEQHHPDAARDLLEAKIEELIEVSRVLDRKRREHKATAEHLAEDNAKLRRILQHTHQQIQELTENIRMMEQ
jgi:hypothetical protein